MDNFKPINAALASVTDLTLKQLITVKQNVVKTGASLRDSRLWLRNNNAR